MRLFLIIVIVLVFTGLYFFTPFDGIVEKLRVRAEKIIRSTNEPLPTFDDVKEVTSSFTNVFEVDPAGEAEGTVVVKSPQSE